MNAEYRAWRKETLSMSEVYFINWMTEKVGIKVHEKKRVIPLNDVVLMRNTGKQDILGECVYEGDFLESHQGTQILDILMLVKYGTFEAYCPVDDAYMDNVGFFVEAADYPQMPVGPLSEYAKVIGNVYQNSDWLDV